MIHSYTPSLSQFLPEDCIVPNYFMTRVQVLLRQGQVSGGNFALNAWDYSTYGPKIVIDMDGTYRMFYTGYENGGTNGAICVATSTDLITWTKANLGLVTYGGNTNNNIVILAAGNNLQVRSAMIDPLTSAYVLLVQNLSTGSAFIYTSTNGTTFTYLTGGTVSGSTGLANGGVAAHVDSRIETQALTWNPKDQKYRIWYGEGQKYGASGVGSNRSIGYYASSALSGLWTNRGFIPEFTNPATTAQYYHFQPFYYAGSMWASVNMYNKTTEIVGPVRLYRSENHGDTWTRSTDLLGISASGQWDDAVITDGCPLLVNGKWYYFYGAKGVTLLTAGQYFLGSATAINHPV